MTKFSKKIKEIKGLDQSVDQTINLSKLFLLN